jgi:aryl-alcohol dehydrogenase-like predicted oxidoreductase
MDVVVKESVANGRLAPGSRDDAPGVRRASELAAGLGVAIDQLAVAAALSQPWVTRVLSGAVTAQQVVSNVASAQVTLPDDVLEEVGTLAEDPQSYWAARSRRSWT